MGLLLGIIVLGATVRIARNLSKTVTKKGFTKDPQGNIQEFLIGRRI